MKTTDFNPDDRLRALLHEARPVANATESFQNRVWQRIERLEREETSKAPHWLARLASLVLQPKTAGAFAVAMLLIGAGIGAAQGNEAARQAAQDRYLASIAPSHVR